MSSLLVFNWANGSTDFFLLPDFLVEDHIGLLTQAQNKFVNDDDYNEGMDFLCAAISKTGEGCSPENEKHCGIFRPYLIEDMDKPMLNMNIKQVFYSGFIL